MQLFQSAPGQGATDGIVAAAIAQQQPQSFAIQGIFGLQFTDRGWS